jgi:vesicle coat complex subunit
LSFQVFILDSLSNYNPKDEREAQSICERITPRLAHANAAVVLSAVKVLMKYMEMMQQVLAIKKCFIKPAILGSRYSIKADCFFR